MSIKPCPLRRDCAASSHSRIWPLTGMLTIQRLRSLSCCRSGRKTVPKRFVPFTTYKQSKDWAIETVSSRNWAGEQRAHLNFCMHGAAALLPSRNSYIFPEMRSPSSNGAPKALQTHRTASAPPSTKHGDAGRNSPQQRSLAASSCR